ncbi:hypothetical protein CALCODRAFT_487531 [Calocera cornea HHB12733]|uniref:Uncharacterized protein n=1 Tax=Calocera cornea HHB12733 TaxID=1353952 RepID=A0A165D2P0_9BASI|nr:hypothetical protein CALCODRAFT_487531 [Calocera cornea HHB12733]
MAHAQNQNHLPQPRSGSPTPIFERYKSSHSFPLPPPPADDDEDQASPSQPLYPGSSLDSPPHSRVNNPYRRPSMPASPTGNAAMQAGKRSHPLSNLLTPSSSTPTLASEVDGDSTYDPKRGSNVHVTQAASSSTPYLGTPSEDEKHSYLIPNVASSNSNGGLLAWLAEDEKRRSGEAAESRNRPGSLVASGEETRRVGYVDGLKFLCGLIAMNAAFLAITQEEPGAVIRSSPLYVVRSANVAVQGLLLLSGRSLPIPLPHASPLLSLSLVTRPLRFLPPVIVVLILQWGLCAGGHTGIMWNVLAIDEPNWCGITNAAGFFTLLWGLFGSFSYNTGLGQAFGANLWSVPWFFQSSYFTYLLHIVVSALPSNRYWIFIALFCFTWSTFSYFTPALLGYMVYDMSTMFLPRIRRMPLVQRMLVQALLLGLIIVFEFVTPTRNAIDTGMAAWNVRNVTEIQFGDTVFVTLTLLWVEITPWAQLVLGNFLVRYLFILTPGMYLLTPSLVYTLVPSVMSHFAHPFTNAGALFAAWAALLVTVVSLSVVFYFLVVYPTAWACGWLCSFLVSWGPDADPDCFADSNVSPPAAEGKRRIYVEKPFRSFSLVTSAFGTPIGSPAPSVRRMRMDEASIRGSQNFGGPHSPRIEMTPLASPEGGTPHGSAEHLPFNGNSGRNGYGHSRSTSQDSNGKRPESFYGPVLNSQPPMMSPMQQRPSQSPPPTFHMPPPPPPKGARMPQGGPYYQG